MYRRKWKNVVNKTKYQCTVITAPFQNLLNVHTSALICDLQLLIIPFFTRWSSQKQHRHSLCCAHVFAEGSMCSDPNTLSTIPSTHPPSRLGVHTHGLFLPHSSPTFRSHISLFSLPFSIQWDQQGTRTAMWSSWKKSITYVAIWTNNPAVNNKERAQKWYYIYSRVGLSHRLGPRALAAY